MILFEKEIFNGLKNKTRLTNYFSVSPKMFNMPWSIYPYSNYLRYGSSSDFFKLYFIDNTLFTRYYDSIQICSKRIKEEAVKYIVDFINENNIRMISGPTMVINSIFRFLGRGKVEHGTIFELKKFDVDLEHSDIKLAKKNDDFHKIAELVCEANSDNTAFYTLKQYYEQILSRNNEGYCRNWIYMIDSQIVGHIATYAETPHYCVLGGLAVDGHFRGKGIAKKLLSYSMSDIGGERTIFVFCFNENLKGFYKKISSCSYPTSKILLK